eukprot:CAMPEP_0197650948 /NCGR_PEP_ID=MMETSP1338-20131121/31259_1 /TAXON_ID=43686 ORGANISM="Pelagodinium beii, Strain RCC1491" /NCGR_SAMPLE_ID=MMETSP1338 /ASSEMBLY_ACC=CAM_ASM_000754 /LENGTH=270 /DNA_ID=CAMNT_0043225471 /DNA_START=64 /DNA_END=876 /DNA_ORIENTATION=-
MAAPAVFALVGVMVLALIGYNGLRPGSSLAVHVRRLQDSSPETNTSSPKTNTSSPKTAASVEISSTQPCLCVFDIDRTLTGKQNDVYYCPRNKVMTGVHDGAYGSGDLTLSALAAEGISNTFCGQCYLGICSAGDAGGDNSEERTVLLDQVLKTPLYEALRAKVSSASWWSWSDNIQSPLVLGSPNTEKQYSVEGIRRWYQQEGISISSSNVYFFGDRRENIPPFAHLGFNAKEISCESRDPWLYGGSGMVGYCGATPEEVVAETGVKNC